MAKPNLSAIQPLPLRVAHERYETAYSLLNRLAVRNGCKSLPHLFQRVPGLLGMPKWPRRELAIELAAALSGSGQKTIASCTPQYQGKQAVIARYSGLASALTFKICVKCINEDTRKLSESTARSAVYIRDFWHFAKINHCRKHWLALPSRCKGCNALFTHSTLSGFRCSCGSDVRKQASRRSKHEEIVREYAIFEKMDRLPAGHGRQFQYNRRLSWADQTGEKLELSKRQLMLIGPQILMPRLPTTRWDLEPWELYGTAGPYLQKAQDERHQRQRLLRALV